ncbi:MAG: hypothetical protein LBU51_07405 [Bacteroidales bacterium]|jgi:hypothetical protein|nr:hypothetical protein [Bacteroidales bacterium]
MFINTCINRTASGYKLVATILDVNCYLPANVYPENIIYITGASGWGKIPAVTCPFNF